MFTVVMFCCVNRMLADILLHIPTTMYMYDQKYNMNDLKNMNELG